MGKLQAGKPKPNLSWRLQKYCTDKCRFVQQCPYISISRKDKVDGHYLCKIKQSNPEMQNWFFNIFENGEEGLISIMQELLVLLMIKARKDPSARVLKEAIETALAMKKGIYGDKDQGNQTVVNVIISNQVDV